MKNFLYILIVFLTGLQGYCGVSDSLLNKLDAAIKNKQQYVNLKERRIAAYKLSLTGDVLRQEEYMLNEKLYGEYRKFRIDSAQFYINRNLEIAELLKDPYRKQKTQIQQANLYSSAGSFLEAQALLKGINSKILPTAIKALYYEFYSQFYEHYTTNNTGEYYKQQIEVYRDSLIAVLDKSSAKYSINLAQRYIYKKDLAKAEKLLYGLMAKSKKQQADYAMFVYLLGDVYMLQKNEDKGLEYYTRAAITDIENGIKDHGAMQNLAIYYYYSGKIDLSYKYARSALEDAVFCNVKFRTLMMSEFYSIINAAYQEKEANGRSKLEGYLVLISVLTVFLAIAIVYVYRQMKKVSKIKEELSLSGKQLQLLNSDILLANDSLKDFNDQLHEANRVKEEYIAQFFDICSSYINKLEEYRRMLNKKAVSKQFDELSKILKSTDFTDDELQGLYKNFDMIFVNLYPTFVDEFNAMLIPQEQIVLREGEILNTELRIFALERLGITDSVKIASFLRYSISTIYNYRTKVRNKAAVPREEFESKIDKIGVGSSIA